MNSDIWIARYEQLNERSRWYTSQLWYIPFAFVALVGLAVDKVLALPTPLQGLALALLALLSFATFVQMAAIKRYERRAVRAMQRLEKERSETVASGGAGPIVLSYTFYLRMIPLVASYVFIWLATGSEFIVASVHKPTRWLGLAVFTGVVIAVMYNDYQRNKELVKDIRSDMKRHMKSPNGNPD